jgi:hypothetical protein
MHEGAAQLTLDSCELTFTDALVLRAAKATFVNQVFRGGIEVPAGTNVVITHSSISFADGVETGLDVEEGGAATATGSTFTVAGDATVAVSVENGGKFTVDSSRLVGAGGAGCERAALAPPAQPTSMRKIYRDRYGSFV